MALEFDGSAFHGWQQQDNAVSVQASLQEALAEIEGKPVSTVAAGRTDSGVHAEALLVHADVSAERWQRSHLAYIHGVNSKLPDTVRVVGVRAVNSDFHARFDCRERAYRYQIWNRNTPSAIYRWRHWWMPRPLDVDAMCEAALCCLGTHDFSTLRASGCQAAHAIRTISRINVKRSDGVITIEVAADAFLYHMVRNLVGNLVDVGLGRQSPEGFARLLDQKDRSKAAATAPAHGLYFVDAVYDGFSSRELIGNS
ncbi:tRNA pseudouridine38-40 synthase [Mariprofundus ferrinatatus]|uniref:tRNA pseudouridine synthase A n=1 Tax=Mariprofundus ferrinatatus TaxID=1921087 RepID=A0A2K8L4C0_9PROT|nr:tRNA pseudouridine(38-40) synthase TruA [Mariprofundus ferrinatatus]ATX82170.1 tRNA pseudouridine38-40 synthase [Mariprofundus ferrinatatus]